MQAWIELYRDELMADRELAMSGEKPYKIVRYPEVEASLQNRYKFTKANNFNSFNELKALFPHADQVGKLTVFNIGGNKVRLIAAIHYNSHKIYIRNILTHGDYDKSKWKE